jgi:hypothetical protein
MHSILFEKHKVAQINSFLSELLAHNLQKHGQLTEFSAWLSAFLVAENTFR